MGDKAAKGATEDVLHSVLGPQQAEELLQPWRELLIEKWRQEGKLEGRAEGRAEGLAMARAEDVLRILAVRGVHVDDNARGRILSCTDMTTLDRWFDQALKATRLSDVLGDLAQ